jgi:hypothetical protein
METIRGRVMADLPAENASITGSLFDDVGINTDTPKGV